MRILIQTDLGLRTIAMADDTTFIKNEPLPGWIRFYEASGRNVYLQEAFVAGIVPDDCTAELLLFRRNVESEHVENRDAP